MRASAGLRADGDDECLGFSVSDFMVIFLGDDRRGLALLNGTGIVGATEE